jgi:hypothetical protein
MKTAHLSYWINEREQMRRRKERVDADYTYGYSDDFYMGTVRYCNVHREDDKVTRWMRQNWSTKDSPVWWFVLGRMLNYIPTLDRIRPYTSLPVLRDVLKDIRSTGEKVFTSAYTISTCGKRMDKIDYVVRVCEAVASVDWITWHPRENRVVTLAEFHLGLTQIDGLGSFLAAQVVADLKNTPGHPLQTAPDHATWCAPGPGSLRGLQAFYGRPVTPRTFVKDIRECYAATMPLVQEHVKPIDMQDFQNCLCEFSKYDRVSRGVGHARNKYTPR